MGNNAAVLADLTTAAGRAELEHAISLAISLTDIDPVRRATALRASLPADIAGQALLQVELRERARAKFGPAADEMFFTRDGLEQASRREVAAHRAERFTTAGMTSVLDLCSGIGADARAFADAGLDVGCVENDPATAQVLTANLAASRAQVTVARAEDSDWLHAESVFLDPGRRQDGRRIFDPAAYSPSFDFVLTVLEQARAAAVKLAPGLPHDLVPDGVEADWVSWAGAVKETVLWSPAFAGAAAAPAARRASVIGPSGLAQLSSADPESDAIGDIGAFVYEPDGAVIRAGLVRQFAALLPGGRRIDPHLAYLSGDAAISSPLARGYRVLDLVPYSVKGLRAELRRREVGIVEIKKRGVDVDPAVLRRQLKPSGPNSLTVLLARVGDRHLVILAEPVR